MGKVNALWMDEQDKYYEQLKLQVASDYGLDPVKDENQIDEIIADEVQCIARNEVDHHA
jgi:hypothetical protein